METLTFCEVLTRGAGLGLKQKIEALKNPNAEFFNRCFVKKLENGLELISENYKERAFVKMQEVVFWRILATSWAEIQRLKKAS